MDLPFLHTEANRLRLAAGSPFALPEARYCIRRYESATDRTRLVRIHGALTAAFTFVAAALALAALAGLIGRDPARCLLRWIAVPGALGAGLRSGYRYLKNNPNHTIEESTEIDFTAREITVRRRELGARPIDSVSRTGFDDIVLVRDANRYCEGAPSIELYLRRRDEYLLQPDDDGRNRWCQLYSVDTVNGAESASMDQDFRRIVTTLIARSGMQFVDRVTPPLELDA
ncbi:hypothetical protein AAKU55_002324 [Oxalobacteraceae bacterium GrIS 1.11]